MSSFYLDLIRKIRAEPIPEIAPSDPVYEPETWEPSAALLENMKTYIAQLAGVPDLDLSIYEPHPIDCDCHPYYVHELGCCSRCGTDQHVLTYGSRALCPRCIIVMLHLGARIRGEAKMSGVALPLGEWKQTVSDRSRELMAEAW